MSQNTITPTNGYRMLNCPLFIAFQTFAEGQVVGVHFIEKSSCPVLQTISETTCSPSPLYRPVHRRKIATCRILMPLDYRNNDICPRHVKGQTMKAVSKFHLKPWHVKAFLWLWVMLYPVVTCLAGDNGGSWGDVVEKWGSFVPFLVLYLMFDLLVVPRLLQRKHIVMYIAAALGMLSLFVFYEYQKSPSIGPRTDMTIHPHDAQPPRDARPPMRDDSHFRPSPPPGMQDVRKGSRPVPGYVIDGVIAFLMMGFDLTVALLFQMQKEREKMRQMESANLQNEIKYLKAQLNPHFLMNMLNNIHSMIEVDPAKAQEMVINFSKLLRYALYEGGAPMVSLSHEAAFISNYVTVMRQRFSSRKVDISLSIPDFIPERLMVPPMLFIVFIENAFKHGVSYRQNSFVEVTLSVMSDMRVRFTCRNSVVAAKVSTGQAGGIGLENVTKRLSLLFGTDYRLDIEEDIESYNVTLEIPTDDAKHTMPGGGR